MPTPYQIYQAYLRSPAAILRLFGQTFGTAVLCDPPAPEDLQQQTISASRSLMSCRHACASLSTGSRCLRRPSCGKTTRGKFAGAFPCGHAVRLRRGGACILPANSINCCHARR